MKFNKNLEENSEMIIQNLDLLDKQLYYGLLGDFKTGYEIGLQLQKERPTCNRCKFNMGWYELQFGNLHKGHELLTCGRFENVFGNRHIGCSQPIWDGKPLKHPNNFILFNCEGGFGDQIIGIRFVKEIVNKYNGRVIVRCSEDLAGLFSNIPEIHAIITDDTLISPNKNPIHFDYWVPSMSAEYILNLDFNTIPNKSYLTISDSYKSFGQEKIKKNTNKNKKDNKLNVGIRLSGNPQFEHEQHRLFPEELLFNVLNKYKDKLNIYSLQKDNTYKLPDYIIDLDKDLNSWENTAGIISNLDLVISSCTSVAHLSASMGIPTWIVVPVLSYYVWAYKLNLDPISNGEFTSYYDSARIFRQEKYNDWAHPFNNIELGLKNILI